MISLKRCASSPGLQNHALHGPLSYTLKLPQRSGAPSTAKTSTIAMGSTRPISRGTPPVVAAHSLEPRPWPSGLSLAISHREATGFQDQAEPDEPDHKPHQAHKVKLPLVSGEQLAAPAPWSTSQLWLSPRHHRRPSFWRAPWPSPRPRSVPGSFRERLRLRRSAGGIPAVQEWGPMRSTTHTVSLAIQIKMIRRHCQENQPSRDAMGLDMMFTDFWNKFVKGNVVENTRTLPFCWLALRADEMSRTQRQPAWACVTEPQRAPVGSSRLCHPRQRSQSPSRSAPCSPDSVVPALFLACSLAVVPLQLLLPSLPRPPACDDLEDASTRPGQGCCSPPAGLRSSAHPSSLSPRAALGRTHATRWTG